MLGPGSDSGELEHTIMMLAFYELVEAVAADMAVYAVLDSAVAYLQHIPAVHDFLAYYAVRHSYNQTPL